jgi:hypothetical protein
MVEGEDITKTSRENATLDLDSSAHYIDRSESESEYAVRIRTIKRKSNVGNGQTTFITMNKAATTTTASDNKGESHRIYWQQWLTPSATTSNGISSAVATPQSRRELITSSAAVRLSVTAKAADVTQLLRQTLNISTLASNKNATILSSSSINNTLKHPQYSQDQDYLVLVGTLYSLPRDYVQFEHENKRQAAANGASGGETQQPQHYLSRSSDPFHVVRTLHPQENPVTVRHEMTAHLQKLLQGAASADQPSRTIISPKLQWYFLPAATETASPIPNCIDLDGYCTGMEDGDDDTEDQEDDDDDESDDDTDAENDDGQEMSNLLLSRFPWLTSSADTDTAATTQLPDDTKERYRLEERQHRKEQRRIYQLSSSQSALRHYCMSGYLLKRSRRDPHVWRRVHCVLTDDYLWYVSRVYKESRKSSSSDQSLPPLAKHGRIRLTRALLLEPAAEYVPLYRTPNAFEVVAARGTSHVFRATNKPLQLQWIQTLSERIVQSYENSLMENAELIVADECLARNRRQTSVAVQPVWDSIASGQHDSEECCSPEHVGAILRLGMQVAEYRECCRHVLMRMPAKRPVVVMTPRRPSPRSSDVLSSSSSIPAVEPLDPALQDVIHAAWEQAANVLARVTHVALQVQSGDLSTTGNRKPSRSIETQCRHVDYVITGRFRSAQSMHGEHSEVARPKRPSNGTSNGIGTHNHTNHDPPPMDLFDSLLAELQTLAGTPHITLGNGTFTTPTTTNGDHQHHNAP